MTQELNIVTNDAGEFVRRARARDLGEEVIESLHRLAKLSRLHDVDNAAHTRQLEQTHRMVLDYCLRAGADLTVLFADRVVLVGGQLLKGSRAAYEAAKELGDILVWCGGAELTIARDITQAELKSFADALASAMRSRKSDSFTSPTPKVRLRQVSEAALMRGIDVEHLGFEQRIVRTYATAVVIMRRFFDDLRQGRLVLPRRLKRMAQSLVDLSEGNKPAFLGVTEMRNANHDDAGLAVNTAILAVAMARELTADRGLLVQLALASLLFDAGRPRALAAGRLASLGAVTARLSEDAEDRLPAGTAAVLTAMGRLNEATISRTVVTFEALWLRRAETLGPSYRGLREPTLPARIISIARRYNDMVTPEPGLEARSAASALAQLCSEVQAPADRSLLRVLAGTLSIVPPGTLVLLTTGETAEVMGPGARPMAHERPRVSVVMNAAGGLIHGHPEVDLSLDEDGPFVQRVLSIDGWREADGRPRASSVPPSQPRASVRTTTQARDVRPAEIDSVASGFIATEPIAPANSWTVVPSPRWSSPPRITDCDSGQLDGRTILQKSPFGMLHDESEEAIEGGLEGPPGWRLARNAPTAEGDLEGTPLVHMLVYMLDRTLTGTVVLRADEGDEHFIEFNQGQATKARLAQPVALLGDGLVQAGAVDPEQLQTALLAARRQGLLLGEYLVREGGIGPGQVERALHGQLQARLAWATGLLPATRFAFYRDEQLLGIWGGEGVENDPLDSIVAAARSWHGGLKIESSLRKLQRVRLRMHPLADVSGLRLGETEGALLREISEGSFVLSDLETRGLCNDWPTRSLLYVLLATRQIAIPGKDKPPLQGRRLPDSGSRSSAVATELPKAHQEQLLAHSNHAFARASEPATHPHGAALEVGTQFVGSGCATSTPSDSVDPSTSTGADGMSFPRFEAPVIRGTLATTPFPHLLVYVLDRAMTASLVLREADGTEHTIFFVDGAPAKVKTGRPVALLGDLLVVSGAIDRQRMNDALDVALEIEALVGEYLVIEDIVSRARVVQALEAQVLRKLVALVDLAPTTVYTLHRHVNLLEGWAGQELFPNEPLRVILALVRAWRDGERRRSAVERIRNRTLRLQPGAVVRELAATEDEQRVLEAVAAGTASVSTLVQDQVASEDVIFSVVYALAITRQLTIAKKKGPPMTWYDRRSGLTLPQVAAAIVVPTEAPASWPSISTRLSLIPEVPDSDPPPAAPPEQKPESARRDTQASDSNTISALDAMEAFRKALVALDKGDTATAAALARRAAVQEPTNVDHAALHTWLESVARPVSALGPAIVALTALIRQDSANVRALLYRGKVLKRAQQFERAARDFERVLELDPQRREAMSELRVLRMRLNKR